jgi:hypothetical protein
VLTVFVKRCSTFLFLLALAAWTVSAQEFRGTLTGHVADPSGNGVPNAKVTAKNLATNEEQSQNTNELGDFTMPLLPPGNYSVRVEATGFRAAQRDRVELHTGDKLAVNFSLDIGQVQDTVTVTGDAPMLETATATRGGVVENMRVTELPLNGRNPFALTNLSTGVIFAGNPQFTRPFDNGDNVNFSINGGLRQTNAWLLDGVPDDSITDTDAQRTRGAQNIAYIPTVDATQEFKIVTNFYDAQYGRTGGGVINVATKTGTNQFHGTAYEFMRRYQFDANSIQNNANNRPRFGVDPITKENLGGHKLDQYGTQITGPVWIPKLYRGKDKTFFSFGFENYIESTPSPQLTSVPSLAERGGDFSALPVTIYDPLTTKVNPNFDTTKASSASNPQYIRDAFAGNIIPSSRFNTVGKNIINAYPAPNVGGPTAVSNNFIASPNLSEDHFRNYIARVDHSIGQNERLFFRYAHNRRNQIDNGANGYTGLGKDAQDPLVRLNDNAVADSTTVLSSNMLLDVRLGYTRFIQAAYRTTVSGFDATSIGFPSSFNAARLNALPPRIDMDATYPSWGTRQPSQNTTNLISLEPSLSWVKGRHSLRFGADLRDYRPNAFGGSFLWSSGDFGFSKNFTQRLPEFSDSTSGTAMAALLLGYPNSGILQLSPYLAYHWNYAGLYIQDDIKLSTKLTVNLGLRYDIEGSPTERYNQMNRGFALTSGSPLAGAVKNANATDCPSCANLNGGLLFAGVNGQPRKAFNTEHDHFQPRIGVAYALTTRTVLRGGFGMFYLPESAYGGSLGYAADTNLAATIGGGANAFTPATTLSNPFPNGIVQPTGASLGLNTALGSNVIFANPNRQIPHVFQYSLGVQHQLPWNVAVDASYVGSRSYNINTGDNQSGGARNLNVLSKTQLQAAQANPSFLTQSVANPFAGLIPNNPTLNAANIARSQLLLPYPQFGQVLMAQESVGKLWYDSLQVNATKRYSTSLVASLAYTWSKNLDATAFLNSQDPNPTKALSPADRTHRVVLSGVAQLPFGRGRHFAHNAGRAAEMIVGGWEYNFIGTLQSGTPMNYPGNVNLIGDPTLSGANFYRYFNTCVQQLNGTSVQPNATRSGFESCSNPAWAIRGPNTLQTIPFRSNVLRNPWRPQWDMSLNKRFNFTETLYAQFRFEVFNVLNTPILGGPNTNPTDVNFGFVAANQGNFPRQMQLGFKFSW